MLLIGLLLVFARQTSQVGLCNLSTPPKTWLSTNATGISGYATSGAPANTSSFCVAYDKQNKLINVDYHVDVPENPPVTKSILRGRNNQLYENSCVVQDSRIQMCFPLCFNETVQSVVVNSALNNEGLKKVADGIAQGLNTDWAVTVIQVDYSDPAAHLNASVFLDPALWCSVYIGIKPKIGFAFLYEIQLANIIKK